MLSENLIKAINSQINYEFYSSYSYLAMAAYAHSQDLDGFANFFRVQAQEEVFHAMKFFDYVYQKNGDVSLEAIDKPQLKFKNMVDVLEKGYEHEQEVTKRIYELANLASEEKEHATISLLKWFVDEQVEEEDNFNRIIKKARRADTNPAALYLLDDELAQRVYVAPSTSNA